MARGQTSRGITGSAPRSLVRHVIQSRDKGREVQVDSLEHQLAKYYEARKIGLEQ